MSTATPKIDESKLEAFMGRVLTEMGAAMSAPLARIGEQARPLQGHGAGGPAHLRGGGRARGRRRALRARVAAQPGGRRLRALRPGDGSLHAARTSTRSRWPTRAARFYVLGGFERGRLRCRPTRTSSSSASAPARGWAGTSTTSGCSRGPSASSARATGRTSGRPTGSRRSTACRRSSSAARRVADIGCGHGASTIIMARGVPELALRRLRLPRRLDRARARAPREEAGVGDRVRFEVATAKDYPGTATTWSVPSTACTTWAIRSGASAHVRQTLGRRRHVDGRRAVRGRPRRGQPQPGRPPLLRRVDGALHAELARPGGRARARRAGRGGAARGGDRARAASASVRRATETPFNLILEARP